MPIFNPYRFGLGLALKKILSFFKLNDPGTHTIEDSVEEVDGSATSSVVLMTHAGTKERHYCGASGDRIIFYSKPEFDSQEFTIVGFGYWNHSDVWRPFAYRQGASIANRQFWVGLNSTNDRLELQLALNGTNVTVVQTPSAYNTTWMHFVVTIGGGNAAIYVNGEVKATATYSGTIGDASGVDIDIGGYATSASGSRYVSLFGYWTRALSATEVKYLCSAKHIPFWKDIPASVKEGCLIYSELDTFPRDVKGVLTGREARYINNSNIKDAVPYPSNLKGSAYLYSNYIDIELQPISYAEYTINIWVNHVSLYDYGTPFGEETRFAFVTYAAGYAHFNAGNGSAWGLGISSPNGSVVVGTWYLLSVTMAKGSLKLYINGVYQAGSANNNVLYFGEGGSFGRRHGNTNNYYLRGYLAQCTIYDREISPAAIQQLYSGGDGMYHEDFPDTIVPSIKQDLFAVWELDEEVAGVVVDSHGNNDTTATNVTVNQEGLLNKAYLLNGSSSYITIPTPPPTAPYAILMWAKPNTPLPNTTSSASRKTLFSAAGPSWNPGMWATGIFIRSHCTNEYRDHTISWLDTTWKQVGMIFDGVDCHTIFDGEILVGGTVTAYSPATQGDIYVGRDDSSAAYYWDGLIDQISMWQGRGITQADVERHYNSGAGRFYVDYDEGTEDGLSVGLQHTFPLDEKAEDLSGNENHGTVWRSIQQMVNGMPNAVGWWGYFPSGQYATIPNNDKHNVDYVSVSVWCYPGSFNHNGGIIAKGDTNNRQYWLWMNSDGNLVYAINGESVATGAILSTVVVYHLVLTYDGTTVHVYVNGLLRYTRVQTTPGPIAPHTTGFYINLIPGFSTAGSWYYGQVAIWDRGITHDEVLEMYNHKRILNHKDWKDTTKIGLVSVYEFQTNQSYVLDSGKYRLHGTVTNISRYQAGKIDKSVYFSGSDARITLPIREYFDAGRTLGIAFWLKPNQNITSHWDWIMSKPYTSHVSPHYQFDIRILPTGQLRCYFTESSGSSICLTDSAQNALVAGTWYHIVINASFVDGAYFLEMWIDGVLIERVETNESRGYVNWAKDVYLGDNPNVSGTTYDFQGWMEQMIFYEQAFSASDIAYIYKGGEGRPNEEVLNGNDYLVIE